MKPVLHLAVLAPIFPAARAAAAPNWKAAPQSEKTDEGGFSLGIDTSFAEADWLTPVSEFLGNYYGYLGVAFILLVLFLFARGSGEKKPRSGATDGDEDFFEPGEADRFGGSR